MGKHSYSQTSSSSLQVWSAGETEVNFQPPISGIPDKCFCGGETVLKFSTTDKTRGRIFIGCRDHKEGDGGGDLSTTDKTRGRIFIGCHDHKKGYGGGDHIMKWWDEAITEELQEIKERAAYSVRQDYEDTLWFQQELSKVKAQMEDVRLSERRRLALVNNMLLSGIILIVVLVSLVI